MHTTSQKYVNLTLTPTPTAQLIALALLSGAIWAVSISAIPLVACVPLLFALLRFVSQRRLFPPNLEGHVSLKSRQRLVVRHSNRRCEYFRVTKSQQLLSEWLIVVDFDDGRRRLIWRHSLAEQHYRQFIRWLQQGEVAMLQHQRLL